MPVQEPPLFQRAHLSVLHAVWDINLLLLSLHIFLQRFTAFGNTDLEVVKKFGIDFYTDCFHILPFLPIKRVLKGERAVEAFDFLHALAAQPLQRYGIDVIGGGNEILQDGDLHRQLEQQTALPVIALGGNAFHVGKERIRQVGGILLCRNMTGIIPNGAVDEFRLAFAFVLPIVVLDKLQCAWICP